MTRAVTFNGNTGLHNSTLGQLSDLSTDLSCGVLSYWYRSITNQSVVTPIVLAFSKSANGHCLRHMHFMRSRGSSTYVMLQLQQPTAPPGSGEITSFLGVNPIPLDGQWHHFMIAWNVNTVPYVREAALDGVTMPTVLGTPPPSSTLAFVPFTIDYSIADDWEIGDEDAGGIYLGDLAEMYLQLYASPYIGLDVGVGGQGIQIGGKGFIDMGPVGGPPRNPPVAMEIGPTGADALGIVGLAPQIYCSGDSNFFWRNVTGVPPRLFSIVGSLTDAATDPFP